jgi:arylsulfatase
MKRYNIIIILADQHQAGMMGCAGHPQAVTPNFDRLAAGGVRFTNAYCQNTICTPSRVSILSGQYCHNHGYYGLSGPATNKLPNFMGHFKKAGYRTAAFGKLHLPETPQNWLKGDVDYFGDTYDGPDGDRGSTEFLRELESLGLRDKEDSWHNDQFRQLRQDARPSQLPYRHTQEMWSARKAMEFIEKDPDKPFCIEVAFQKPHHPLLPQKKFWEMYPEDAELPETFYREPGGRPPHFREMWKRFRDTQWPEGKTGESPEAAAKRMWRGTLACVTQIDDVFGKILNFLEQQGISENTIVVYSGDHGSYHTVHGLPEKAPGICSDSVCKIPMIWRVPDISRAGHSSEVLTESVDIAPTLASLCGLPPMETADGVDISSALKGDTAPLREEAVTENPWSKSIRWDRFRMVHYQRETFGKDTGELYDLIEDPGETNNLYYTKEYRVSVEEGRRRLLEWLIRTSRIVTSHPVEFEGQHFTGKRSYPAAGDGKAPNRLQPRYRYQNDPRQRNYI